MATLSTKGGEAVAALVRQLLGQQDEEPQASTSQPGPRPQSGAALLPDVPPHVLEELVLYYFQSNSSNNQQQAPATPGKGPATTATPGGLRAAAASAAAAAANPFLALGSTLPLLQTRLQQPGTPQAPRPSSQGSSTLPSATQPRRKLQAPIFDTDDSTAFLNLLPRIVAQPKHAPVLPLAQTPAKLAAAGTPAAGQRSVGQGATRSKAALPLVSSQLMEDSDIMYPDISPVRRRQPAASFGTGQRASKQKPDDRPALDVLDTLTRKRPPGATIKEGATPGGTASVQPFAAATGRSDPKRRRSSSAVRADGKELQAAVADESATKPDPSAVLPAAPAATFAKAARFSDTQGIRDNSRRQSASRSAGASPERRVSQSHGRVSEPGQLLQPEAALDATLLHKSSVLFPKSPRFKQTDAAANADGGPDSSGTAKKALPATPGVEAARDGVKRRTPAFSLAHPSVKEQVQADLAARRARRQAALEQAALLAGALDQDDDAMPGAAEAAEETSPPQAVSLAPDATLERHVPTVNLASSSARFPSPGLHARGLTGKEPGPGGYEYDDHVLSYKQRPPSASFARSSRALGGSSGVRASSPFGRGAAAAGGVESDADVVIDCIKPRVRTAAFRPLSPPRRSLGEEAAAAEGDDEQDVIVIDVQRRLVEPRARSTLIMRPATPLAKQRREGHEADGDGSEPQNQQAAGASPWTLDTAVRRRHPAWGFFQGGGHAAGAFLLPSTTSAADPLEGMRLWLEPNYDTIKPRGASLVPDFVKAVARFAITSASTRSGIYGWNRMPEIGQYEVAAAWSFIQKHVPMAALQLAAQRWADPLHPAPGEDAGAAGPTPAQLLPQVAAALDLTRPAPPRWTIVPLHAAADRPHGGQPTIGQSPLTYDADWGAVKKRQAAGTVAFSLLPAREDALAEGLTPGTGNARLGPGYYTHVDAGQAAVEPRVHGFEMQRMAEPHQPSELELLEGRRLQLDAAGALEGVLPRHAFTAYMDTDLGRRPRPEEGAAPGVLTRRVGLPDADLGDYLHRHVPQVDLEHALPHELPHAGADDPQAPRRGPGYVDLSQHRAVGKEAPAADFAHGGQRFPPDAAAAAGEGDRLELHAAAALDGVRPAPPTAIIHPEHGELDPLVKLLQGGPPPRFYDANVDAIKPAAPGGPNFDAMLGRAPGDDGSGLERRQPEYGQVPLELLSEHRAAPSAINFDVMRPHPLVDELDAPLPDGARLPIRPELAKDFVGTRHPGAMDMGHGEGHMDGAPADAELTAWLDYHPNVGATRPRPLDLVDYDRMVDREAVGQQQGPPATGDLDGGVYRVQRKQVEKAAPAIDFSRAAPVERLELPQGKDEDEGNVLLLHPQLPVGYAGPDTSEPHKQPFHRHTERWQDSMRSTDGGNVLLLRTSADDVANPSGRIRFANAPGLIFGCANRFEVVEQPRDQGADIIGARALEMMKAAGKQRRRTAPAPTGQRIETALRQWGDGRDPLLDLIKAAPPGATIVQDIQRQDRVIRRMQAKFGEQDA